MRPPFSERPLKICPFPPCESLATGPLCWSSMGGNRRPFARAVRKRNAFPPLTHPSVFLRATPHDAGSPRVPPAPCHLSHGPISRRHHQGRRPRFGLGDYVSRPRPPECHHPLNRVPMMVAKGGRWYFAPPEACVGRTWNCFFLEPTWCEMTAETSGRVETVAAISAARRSQAVYLYKRDFDMKGRGRNDMPASMPDFIDRVLSSVNYSVGSFVHHHCGWKVGTGAWRLEEKGGRP